MQKLKFDKSKRALIIVAHPDDETIWMNGFILKHPQMDWTIFSLCRASDSDRAPKFKKVCKHYGAKAIITNLEDDGKLSLKQTLSIIKKLITKNVSNKKFDYVFTHGANGEYGHPRHIGVHQAVKSLANNGKLKTKTIFYFNYQPINPKEFSPVKAKPDSGYTFKLTKAEFNKKKKIMTDIYGFDPDGIDVGYCTNPEAFLVKKIQGHRKRSR